MIRFCPGGTPQGPRRCIGPEGYALNLKWCPPGIGVSPTWGAGVPQGILRYLALPWDPWGIQVLSGNPSGRSRRYRWSPGSLVRPEASSRGKALKPIKEVACKRKPRTETARNESLKRRESAK